MIENDLRRYIAEALDVPEGDVSLEHPAELTHGDYATNIALIAAKKEGKNPREYAQELVTKLEAGKPEMLEHIEVAGPGFINLHLSRAFFTQATQEALSRGDAWGANEHLNGKRVMVEYTQPNPFKAFHIGHLMSNAIGESLSRLVEYSGAEVKRANYQGDVGVHVAKAIWGLREEGGDPTNVEELGRAYARGAKAYEESEEAKQAIGEINKRLYARDDKELNALYDQGRKSSLEHFEHIYEKLGTAFDYYFFESETGSIGLELVRSHPNVFEESDGALVYRGEKHGLHTRVFVNSQGLPTYEAKELGLIKAKEDAWPLDTSITVTANEVDEYFKVVVKAMEEVLPELAGKVEHVSHGMMRLPSGKMSSRTGDVIEAEALLDSLEGAVRDRIHERGFEKREALKLEQEVAVAAIKYAVLKQSTGKDITFDADAALSFEGDSGPYLQYAYTRARSVLEKARAEGVEAKSNTPGENVYELERLLYRFPEVVRRAVREYEPHYVTTFLITLAGAFNSWYAREQILDGSPEASYKLALTSAFAQTIKNGLWLLGIRAPERM